MRAVLLLIAVACAAPACRTTVSEPPPGCVVNYNGAVDLAAQFLAAQSLDWGDPTQSSFDGTRFRLVYETPAGETQRSVLVDCLTGKVDIFVP